MNESNRMIVILFLTEMRDEIPETSRFNESFGNFFRDESFDFSPRFQIYSNMPEYPFSQN